jgi:hypothetical protein
MAVWSGRAGQSTVLCVSLATALLLVGSVGGKHVAAAAAQSGATGVTIRTETGNTTTLTWAPGTADQGGYRLVRFDVMSEAVRLLPLSGERIPSHVSTFSERWPPMHGHACYQVVGFHFLWVSSVSDLLCAAPEAGRGVEPQAFTLRLNDSTVASLSWDGASVSGHTGYRLIIIPMGGGQQFGLPLPPAATTAMYDTRGEETCLMLGVFSGSEEIGRSDLLCGAPGTSLSRPSGQLQVAQIETRLTGLAGRLGPWPT